MKLFEMNDYDTVCANTIEEAKKVYKELTDIDCDEEGDEVIEIPDKDLDKRWLYMNEELTEKKTFREALKDMKEPGFFCSTEH